MDDRIKFESCDMTQEVEIYPKANTVKVNQQSHNPLVLDKGNPRWRRSLFQGKDGEENKLNINICFKPRRASEWTFRKSTALWKKRGKTLAKTIKTQEDAIIRKIAKVSPVGNSKNVSSSSLLRQIFAFKRKD